jgi:hypothetical protein
MQQNEEDDAAEMLRVFVEGWKKVFLHSDLLVSTEEMIEEGEEME